MFFSLYLAPFNDGNSNQHHTTDPMTDSPTSPLDLSTTSTRFPFVHRSTSHTNVPSSPLDLSVKDFCTNMRQMSIDETCEEPIFLTQPKQIWHYRSMKDLAKKHIPLVSGEGPQRTPIRIQVSI